MVGWVVGGAAYPRDTPKPQKRLQQQADRPLPNTPARKPTPLATELIGGGAIDSNRRLAGHAVTRKPG